MNAYEKIEKLKEKEFKLITGITKEVFTKALEVLKQRYTEEHERGGRPGLPVGLRLTLALEYWREYRTFRHMANDHQIGKSKINNAVLWVENVLSGPDGFKLKDLKERFKQREGTEPEIQTVLRSCLVFRNYVKTESKRDLFTLEPYNFLSIFPLFYTVLLQLLRY